MSKKNVLIAAVAALLLVCVAFFFFFKWERSGADALLAVLPEPQAARPYALLETRDGNYPAALSALLTEGAWATLHKGTSRNAVMLLASLAKDVAMLVAEDDAGYTEVYAAMRFAPHEMKKLEQGTLPESWKTLFESISNERDTVLENDADTWKLWNRGIDAPILYYVRGDMVVLAGGEEPFNRLLSIRDDASAEKWTHVWRDEPAWEGHIEIGDGGLLLSGSDKNVPLRIQTAWHALPVNAPGDPAGEARWSVSGLKSFHKAALLLAAKPREWVISDCIVPEPILASVALNIPELKGPPDEWPFPLDTLVQLGKSIGLDDRQVKEVISGRTLFSLGGQNRILWLSLPGVLTEFTGDKQIMREMIDAFWGKFFFGSDPRPVEGFEYGGWINIPFSVIGAGRGDLTVLGLISPESMRAGGALKTYLNEKETAIGWLVADLPRLADALGDMTRMSSLLMFEDGEGPGFISGLDDSQSNGYFFSDLDQSVSDSFARILRKFGKLAIVWEKSESGRMQWYP